MRTRISEEKLDVTTTVSDFVLGVKVHQEACKRSRLDSNVSTSRCLVRRVTSRPLLVMVQPSDQNRNRNRFVVTSFRLRLHRESRSLKSLFLTTCVRLGGFSNSWYQVFYPGWVRTKRTSIWFQKIRFCFIIGQRFTSFDGLSLCNY